MNMRPGDEDVTPSGDQPVHQALAQFGCVIQPNGDGMVVTTSLSNDRVLAAKASLVGRWGIQGIAGTDARRLSGTSLRFGLTR